MEETDSSHFIQYLCNEYHVSSQLITEQGLSNYSESMRLRWQDTPGRNWEEGKNFQMRAFIITLRNKEVKKHLFLLPEAQPGPRLNSQRFHISLPGELKEREEWAPSFFLKSTKCAKHMAGNEVLAYWSWWYCIKIFCRYVHLDPEFPGHKFTISVAVSFQSKRIPWFLLHSSCWRPSASWK